MPSAAIALEVVATASKLCKEIGEAPGLSILKPIAGAVGLLCEQVEVSIIFLSDRIFLTPSCLDYAFKQRRRREHFTPCQPGRRRTD